MSRKKMELNAIEEYGGYLYEEERSAATIKKYLHDLTLFYHFLPGDKQVEKGSVIEFKRYLGDHYKISSANSILAAVNSFFTYKGWNECKVKQYKVQKNMFCRKEQELSKEEYKKLVKAALEHADERLSLLMQAICSTGIRVSEHRFLTVEAVEKGYAVIRNKGKVRTVFMPSKLQEVLKEYCNRMQIQQGPVFITKNGNPLDRSNIWTMMKALCRRAGVDAAKVYPHNLRHLFAYTFYGTQRDLLRLSDILGHTSIETTRVYTISSGSEHKREISGLGLVLDKGNNDIPHNVKYVVDGDRFKNGKQLYFSKK